uniref:DUF4238 domain-containing protein n=1 Tax=Rhabditophanes sp. KR3021 TaxID=114890 RepID=A0AC35UHL8_9BILA
MLLELKLPEENDPDYFTKKAKYDILSMAARSSELIIQTELSDNYDYFKETLHKAGHHVTELSRLLHGEDKEDEFENFIRNSCGKSYCDKPRLIWRLLNDFPNNEGCRELIINPWTSQKHAFLSRTIRTFADSVIKAHKTMQIEVERLKDERAGKPVDYLKREFVEGHKSDEVKDTRIYLLRHPVTKKFFYGGKTKSVDAKNAFARFRKHADDTPIKMLSKCPLTNKYGCQMSLKGSEIAFAFDEGKAVEVFYSKGKYDEQTAFAMEHYIAQAHPEFTNAATNRMSTFMLLADEDTVQALGNAFFNDLVNDMKSMSL